MTRLRGAPEPKAVPLLHEFSYVAHRSLDELLSFLAHHGDETQVFSGGTDLFVNIRAGLAAPRYVADLKSVSDLHEIAFNEREGLSIGACATVNELIANDTVRDRYAVLRTAAEQLATFQLRNRATVVGNIVTASPCGDMTSPLLCLGTDVVLVSARGERRVPLGEFITGVKTTQIATDEIVTRVIVGTGRIDAAGGYRKLKRIKGHDLGVVAVALIKSMPAVRVAISSAAPTPVLLPEFGADTPVAEIQASAQAAISPIDDVRCTAEYRRFMVDVYIRRLMEEVPA